jgi:hypothetical protein
VEEDKLFHPVQVGLLGADGIMLDMDADPVEVRIHTAAPQTSRRMNPHFVSNKAFEMVRYETAVLLYRKDVPRISAGFPRANEIYSTFFRLTRWKGDYREDRRHNALSRQLGRKLSA